MIAETNATDSRIGLITAGLLGILLLAGAFAPAVGAKTFTVTTTTDTNDGACDAHCSLREALIAANRSPGTDTIELPAGTFRLAIAGRWEDHGATGDLDVRDSVVIRGAGEAVTTIDGGGIDRVLHVLQATHGAAPVEIEHLRITGGLVGPHEEGGGVLNSGTLVVRHCTIAGNVAAGAGGDGGGIANGGGTVVLEDTIVSGNTARGDGSNGGGIWNHVGTMALARCAVIGNRVEGRDGSGGGLWSGVGTVAVAATTVGGNTVAGDNAGGGGIWAALSTISLVGSTVSDNSLGGARWLRGGGIVARDSTVRMANCTISGNTATGAEGAAGGLWADASTLAVESCTLSGNRAGRDGAGESIASSNGALLFINTLVDGSCLVAPRLTSGGGNLESPGATCGFSGGRDWSSVTAKDLGLDVLADNGGPTQTHALLPGSVAIDHGVEPACPAADQRGQPRPRDGDGDGRAACDIGAFEYSGDATAVYGYWVPVAVHAAGANGSLWRTVVYLVNRSPGEAAVEFVLHTPDGSFSAPASVAGNSQGVFEDVAGWLGVTAAKGALEVRSTRPLVIGSRTLNENPAGAFGQYLGAVTPDRGLGAGDRGVVPLLVASAAFRSNLGVVNTGPSTAEVEIAVSDAAGNPVGSFVLSVPPGQLRQEDDVFRGRMVGAGVASGYAEVRVRVGSGVFAFASVVDGVTGQATAVPIAR